MMDTSRIYFEHPPSYAAIKTVHGNKKINGYNSISPAKAKRSWGDLLRIPGRSKKNSSNAPSNHNSSYPPAFNMPCVSPYQPDSYLANSNITVRQYDPYGREYVANYGPYGSYNTTYSRTSIVSAAEKSDSRQKKGFENKSITYADWFGTVISKQPPTRPRLNGPSSPFYTPDNNHITTWDGLGSVRSPAALVPATFPVQLYSNMCLCPEQLYSTKTKSRKKCKKCGCKIATLRNATSITATKVRPVIPPSFYQPPSIAWQMPPTVPLPSHYALPSNQPDVKSTFSPLQEIDEYESPPRTPETIKSIRSTLSADSNATITKSRIRPPSVIPHPPKLPLPSIPKNSDTNNKKTSIMDETRTAYELMDDIDDNQRDSNADEVSDKIINNLCREKIDNKSHPVCYDALNISPNKRGKPAIRKSNALKTDELINSRQNNYMNTFGDFSNISAVKLRSKSSPNITNNLDLVNNRLNMTNSPGKELLNGPINSYYSQYGKKSQRYSDIPSLKKSNELQNCYNQNSKISKSSSHQSLLNYKNNAQKDPELSFKSKCRPMPPRRDESKLVSIAGQRILFDKGRSPSINTFEKSNNKGIKFYELQQNETATGTWEDVPEREQCTFEIENTRDKKVVTSLREPNESNINKILKPFGKRNFGKEYKSNFYAANFDMVIQEEDEVEEKDYCSKNTSNGIDIYNAPTYEESDISSVSDSSPERNNRFQTSLSDLLHVKSILKRPNSVDTSSENDSDFYLPTYSEFKQMQRKKKSVQFIHSSASSAVIENEKDLPVQCGRELFHEEIEEEVNLESGISKIETKQSQSTNLVDTTDEKLSELSIGLCHRLGSDQTIDLKDKEFTSNHTSSNIPINHHSNPGGKKPKKSPSSSHLSSIPNRPTVPPPPPPPHPLERKSRITETDRMPINYHLSSISLGNVEVEVENEDQSISSLSSTPPPLPSSSPPPLNDNNYIPVQIFSNSKENELLGRSESKPLSMKNLCSLKSADQSTLSSRIPIINSKGVCHSVNNYKSGKILTDGETFNGKSRSRNSRIPRAGIANNQQSAPCQNLITKHIIKSEVDQSDERFNDHIYEELRSITSSPCSIERSLSPEKSIFDGASKYEILEFLRNARKRVKMDDEDDELFSETIRNEMETISLEDDECRVKIEPQDDMILSSIYRDGRSSNRSSNSDSSENSGLLRSDKERLLTGEIERTDSGVGSETSKPTVLIRQKATASHSDVNGGITTFRERNLPPCDDCDFPVDAKVTNGGLTYAPLVCHRCSRRRQERKEILMEIIETEVKYGRDLKVIMDQFYKPMHVAGLLTRDQLRRIFTNIEELVDHNRSFALQIKDAYEIALDQGDEDFLTVNIAKLFLNASSMLHSFQSYCVRQSDASIYLQNLERDRELFRIFLRVSQMENTLLRRMNLHSFLMVPVQRITKYPLLLSRLYKTTPPSHSSREDCRKAREKIELFLQHINNETRGSSSTKLWRRISMSVGGNSSPPKRDSRPPDYDTSLKLRAVALEVLDWTNEEASVVREGRLLCLPPESGNWTRRGRGIKMASVQVALITLGRPRATLEEKIQEDGLITPKNLGIKEAAILAFKDHRLSKSALIRDPWLLSKVVLSWDSEGETESFEITDMITKETFIFKDRDSVSTEEWFRSAQFHALSVGSWRLRRPALANIMINGARS